MRPFLLITAITAILDQGTKIWMTALLTEHGGIIVIPQFFQLILVHNTGAAFGVLAGGEMWKRAIFLAIGILSAAFLAYLYRSQAARTQWLLWGTALVSGGAIGNLADRIRLGAVVDFLDFHLGPYHWPAFNIADIAITVGGACLALHLLRSPHQRQNPPKAAS